MKRNAVYVWMLLLLAFVSCDQMEGLFDKEKNETENLCAVLEATTVPQAVVESFNSNFPGMAVVTWFDKDGIGFCALFIKDNQETIAQFDLAGVLVKTEVDVEQEGEHNDAQDEENGCECETADDKD